MDEAIVNRVRRAGLIAVLVVDRADDAVPLAEALMAGGVEAMELTLRTPAAIEALKRIRAAVPGMLAGIGTILSPDQVAEAADAGAEFGVSPGVNRRVVEAARDRGLPFAPGVATPSDIEQALELGCRTLKFFPAEAMGGLKTLGAMAAPYLHLGVGFIPLGGVNASNAADYLASPLITAIGGSWLATRQAISDGQWDRIRRTAQEAAALVRGATAAR